MRRRPAIVMALLLMATPWPTSAEAAQGCEVFTTGHPSQPGNCRYVASGPGRYEVRTLSGFRIMSSSDGGQTWRTHAARVGEPGKPHTPVAIERGTLDTKDGDLVDVAIAVAVIDTPNGTLRYQDGMARASDDP